MSTHDTSFHGKLTKSQLGCFMRKPTICICENKDADQLRGNREADQCLCFHYIDSTINLLSKSEISSFWPSSVAVQPGLFRTRSETECWFSHDTAQLSSDTHLICSSDIYAYSQTCFKRPSIVQVTNKSPLTGGCLLLNEISAESS